MWCDGTVIPASLERISGHTPRFWEVLPMRYDDYVPSHKNKTKAFRFNFLENTRATHNKKVIWLGKSSKSF